MENNYNNGFPQKPFTEKPDSIESNINDINRSDESSKQSVEAAEPPYTQNEESISPDAVPVNEGTAYNSEPDGADYSTPYSEPEPIPFEPQQNVQGFNAQQNTQANRQGGGYPYSEQINPAQPQYVQQPNYQNTYGGAPNSFSGYDKNTQAYNDYSQPTYQQNYAVGYNQPPACGYPQQNPQNAYNQYGNQPVNGYRAPDYPNYGGKIPYAPQPQKPPKKKTNGGLIAIIIVLIVLLVGSVIGLSVYIVLNNTSDRNIDYDNRDSSGGNYSFTIPDNTTPETNETIPQSNNESSDYSDKINKDYKGLTLESKPKDVSTNKSYTAESSFNKVSDSVVGVVCYTDKITSVENCASQGSGIIITSDGYVVTNAHVIGNSKTAYLIQIVTSDGTKYTAGVVGFDSRTDIAVLKMDDAKNLTPATFGDSDKIELGEDIIVVGNPGGLDYQNSITKGVVSAVNRELSSTSLVKYIQTDAAINPGNSGGPIVNLYGQVIGIATSKIVSEKYEGMGFAIPSATAKDIVDDLMKYGYIEGRVKIGISGTAIDAATAKSNNVPQGILVQTISEGGPCDNTELKIGDIITEADGQTVTSFADIYEILENHKTGDKIEIKYYRLSEGSEGTIEVTLQEDK